MHDAIQSASPLARFDVAALGGPGCEVSEKAFQAHINLRGSADDASFADAVGQVLRVALPRVANTVARNDDVTAYWLGPEEWLMVASGTREQAIASELRAVIEGGGGRKIMKQRDATTVIASS